MPWVQPYPDSLLDKVAAGQPGLEAVAVNRDTMSLAFLAAIQLLPPRQIEAAGLSFILGMKIRMFPMP